MSDALDRMLREARRDWAIEAKNVRWDKVESRLFARVAAERRSERDALAAGGNGWAVAGAALVSAFAIGLVVWTTHEPAPLDAEHARAVEDGTTITRVDGAGAVLVNGHAASAGTSLQAGDVIEARAAQATISRPGKATFVIERGSSAAVTHLQGAIILSLARGAIEAQVVPVATSEAMAIDVGPTRVAVHGTRFRIARTGEHVTVDLTEGVVAIGQAPRLGSTLGGLVTAPAHAEFVAMEPETTLHVTHDAASVRAATPFDAAPQSKPLVLGPPLSAPASSGGGATARADAGEVSAPAGAGTPRGEQRPMTNASGWAPGTIAADPNAQVGIASAVRACLAERVHGDTVTVVVSTMLVLQLHDDGTVSSARFDPPVAPDVNACAAEAIYRARFTHGGSVSIPVSVKN